MYMTCHDATTSHDVSWRHMTRHDITMTAWSHDDVMMSHDASWCRDDVMTYFLKISFVDKTLLSMIDWMITTKFSSIGLKEIWNSIHTCLEKCSCSVRGIQRLHGSHQKRSVCLTVFHLCAMSLHIPCPRKFPTYIQQNLTILNSDNSFYLITQTKFRISLSIFLYNLII